MSSGKQTSFSYGEISPLQRFKSNEVSYAEGLSKLYNGWVRKTGGVSNRPGFLHIRQLGTAYPATAENMPYENGDMQMRLMYSPLDITEDVSVGGGTEARSFKEQSLFIYQVRDKVYDSNVDAMVNQSALIMSASLDEKYYSWADLYNIYGPGGGAKNARMSYIGNGEAVITFNGEGLEPGPSFLAYHKKGVIFNITKGVNILPPPDTVKGVLPYLKCRSAVGVGSLTGDSLGNNPYFPVAYLITQEFYSGEEVEMYYIDSSMWVGSPPAKPWHPHAQAMSFFDFDVPDTREVKNYNIYRSPGSRQSAFGLVGRVSVADGEVSAHFADFQDVADVTRAPPINNRLFSRGTIDDIFSLGNELVYARNMVLYQQRLIIAQDHDNDSNFEEGGISVSKLGSPKMLWMPNVFDNINAFEFTIPSDKKSPIVGMLPMERLIVLTENYTFAVMGGEQGILTPTSINPKVISETGCSKYVAPCQSGSAGYYLNSDHTKVMKIEFSIDGNVKVFPIITLSEHFLEGDVVQMETVQGNEDKVFLLLRDGRLICIATENGMQGASLIETDGRIETICSAPIWPNYNPFGCLQDAEGVSLKPQSRALFAIIIRDGVRNLEVLYHREDLHKEGQIYADAAVFFGHQLVRTADRYADWNGTPGRIVAFRSNEQNIVGGTTWSEGDSVILEYVEEGAVISSGFVEWFYDEEVEGEIQTKSFILEITGAGSDPDTLNAIIRVGEIPEQLRDVDSQNPADKLFLKTRWVPLTKRVYAPHLAGKQVSVFADGMVISSPNNPLMQDQILEFDEYGYLDLPDEYGYAYGHVGLPYTFEFETLDLESSDNRTLTDANKIINSVGGAFDRTYGGFVGNSDVPLSEMSHIDQRNHEIDLSEVTEPLSGYYELPVSATWGPKGRVNIKQVDPLPMTILSVYPKGMAGD